MRYLLALVVLSSCGSGPTHEPSRQAATENPDTERSRTDDPEALEIAPPPLLHDTPIAIALLAPNEEEVWSRLSAIDTVVRNGECEYLSEDGAAFGATLASYRESAEERNFGCEPETGGFRCTMDLRRHSGGEGVEFAVFLRFRIDAEKVIDIASIECGLAG